MLYSVFLSQDETNLPGVSAALTRLNFVSLLHFISDHNNVFIWFRQSFFYLTKTQRNI